MTKSIAAEDIGEPKGHICPPSDAKHPRDRWETLFVYAFIVRFTQLRGKVEGLDSPMDFEEALMNEDVNPVMTSILSRFVLNLRPQARNLSADVISSTISGLFQEFLKGSERGVFWDEQLKRNVDPLQNMEKGFWGADWDLKLKVLRQLVELQLCHSFEIKRTIDRAWGVVHNKHKKGETTEPRPPASDPRSQENLWFTPLGLDSQRKRYWVIDDSPRVYLSTNPWKITSEHQTIASTRDEYVMLLEELRESAPSDPKAGERRTKQEMYHIALVRALEERLPIIDAEIARIQRAQKKIAQRNMLIAQAEIRETRTRRRATRPDYAYLNDPADEQEDQDEYKFQDDEDEDDRFEDDDSTPAREDGLSNGRRGGTRRSTRTAATNGANSKSVDEWAEWRGERRSSRLGAPTETQIDGPQPKRARTTESTSSSVDVPAGTSGNGIKVRTQGAAAVKPTETVVETVAGKKKSKFWVYAVEPLAAPERKPPSSDYEMSDATIPQNSAYSEDGSSMGGRLGRESEERSIRDGVSPSMSMDES